MTLRGSSARQRSGYRPRDRRVRRSFSTSAAWVLTLLAGCVRHDDVDVVARQQEVFATERAFARTMADRDFAAFGTFIAPDAIFFGEGTPLRGRQAIVTSWQRFFAGDTAPFSWRPEQVEVLDSGALALSSGPVYDAHGQCIGMFNSIWRLEDRHWRIVFDKGSSACD
jgi:ketosteroid isomerase-like protein